MPRSTDAFALLRTVPLTRITVKQRYGGGQVEPVIYDFEANNGSLVAGANGDIFVGSGYFQLEDTTTLLLNIKSNVTHKDLARVLIELTPLDVTSVAEFCKLFTSKLCFWDSAFFHVTENRLLETVGALAPSAYRKLCPSESIVYRLVESSTAKAFTATRNGTLETSQPLDFEKAPQLTVPIECSVYLAGRLLGKPHRHEFQVNVVDLNDNGPQLQDDRVYEMKLDHMSFRKVSAVH